jgi:osmoprotectant transport system substrate-binding protein
MNTLAAAWDWLTDPAHWPGDDGIGHRLLQHLLLTVVCLLLSCLIALPVALVLGHLGKGGALAVNISNVGRAVPTFAVLVLLLLTPVGRWGEGPTVVALVLFAVPPLLTNAYVGMREVDRGVVQAARGMGMTGRQLLFRVELPLSLPLLLNGVRLAAVQLVATATIAALAGGGGLGRIITAGFNLASTPQVVAGALLVAALALLTVGACATGPSLENRGQVTAPPGDSRHLTVGSAGFTESDLLAQLYARLLDQAGYRTSVLTVANRELYEPALEAGQIDVVPEYAATFADWLAAKTHGADAPPAGAPDLGTTMRALRGLTAPRGLTVLPPGRAVDQNAFAVTAAYARRYRLRTLSDLGASGLEVRLAAGDECVRRPYCAPGLRQVYGIDITGVDPKGVGTTQAKRAVQSGRDQMVLTTTTDATLDSFGLVLLTDDKRLQNADYVVPVVNRARAGGAGVAKALGRLNDVLTTGDLAAMNRQVDSWRRLPADVARAYLRDKGLLK